MKTIKIGIISYLIYCLALGPSLADTASLLPNAVQQFFDNNGNPLTSGKVTTYAAGTSTLKITWKDSAETLPNTNPITLDGGGKAIIYGSGNYRQVVKDRNGNLIWDAVTAPGGGGSSPTSVGDGNLVGTILPWSGLSAPAQYVFAYGQELSRTIYTDYFTAITQQLNVICTSASNILTGIADTSQVRINSPVELALCVPAGTTVTAKTGATITLSNPSSVSINSVGTFFPWGNGDGSTTFNVPDLRGIVPIGRDNMGGSGANRITTTNCGNGITPDALGAFCNSNPGGGHTNTVSELAAHTHIATTVVTYNSAISPLVALGTTNGLDTFTGAGSATPTAVPSNTNIFATTTNTITGSNVPFSVVPPSLTINYIAKVLPDTSTSIATGVFSIGGMSGVILCGTGILCTGNIISTNGPAPNGPLGAIQFNNTTFGGSANLEFISPDNLTLGAIGVSAKFDILGSTSGRVRQTVPAVAGAATNIAWGNTSGTPAVTATSPIFIGATTGNISISPSSLTGVNDTNVTLTLNTGAQTSVLSPSTLTLGWTGTLSGTRGGTGVNNGASTITIAGNFAVNTNGGSIVFPTAATTMILPNASATIPRLVASGAKTLNTTAIASATCNVQTATATGALVTDVLSASFNGPTSAIAGYAPLTTGGLSIRTYPTADTANFEVCNGTLATITPASITLNWNFVR